MARGKIKLTIQYTGGYKDKAGNVYSEAEGVKMIMQGQATLTTWKNRKLPVENSVGRKKGSKNLKKTKQGFENQYGVTFTPEQKKALERAVDRVNYRRKKQLEAEGQLDRYRNGKPTGQKVSDLQKMSGGSDFILSHQEKTLQRFKNKREYNMFMKKLEKMQDGRYLDEKTRLYKKNHMAALDNVFGDAAKDIVNKLRTMPLDEYRKLLQQDEVLEVGFLYDPEAIHGKLNMIRAAMKMPEKEIPFEEE